MEDNTTTPTEATETAPATEAAPAAAGGAPVAEAPVAEAPVADAPTFASADDWGWDDWDGEATTLPEEVQGWYSRFNDRFGEERNSLNEQISAATKSSKAWEDMFNSVIDGEADPRIAQSEKALTDLQSEYAAYKQEQERLQQAYEEYVDRESSRYFNTVAERHPEIIERLNASEGADDIVLNLMGQTGEGLEFEDALLIWNKGEEAVAFAQQAVNDGVAGRYIKDLVESKFSQQEPAEPPPKPQPKSVDLVTGSEPVRRSAPVPTAQQKPMSLRDKRQAAAERAWAAMSKRR